MDPGASDVSSCKQQVAGHPGPSDVPAGSQSFLWRLTRLEGRRQTELGSRAPHERPVGPRNHLPEVPALLFPEATVEGGRRWTVTKVNRRAPCQTKPALARSRQAPGNGESPSRGAYAAEAQAEADEWRAGLKSDAAFADDVAKSISEAHLERPDGNGGFVDLGRHTFASQWVINGGSIEKLREAMGHSSVVVTERYAHLRGDVFTAADLGRVTVDFSSPVGKILPLVRTDSGTLGAGLAPGAAQTGIAG
jgi:hypothetical protein